MNQLTASYFEILNNSNTTKKQPYGDNKTG